MKAIRFSSGEDSGSGLESGSRNSHSQQPSSTGGMDDSGPMLEQQMRVTRMQRHSLEGLDALAALQALSPASIRAVSTRVTGTSGMSARTASGKTDVEKADVEV